MTDTAEVRTVPIPGAAPLAEVAPSPLAMLDKAIATGADVAVMERLMSLYEKWQATQARVAFTQAITAMRSELPAIVKTEVVDYTTNKGTTRYEHESLPGVVEALSPVLSKHDLTFRWRTDSSSGNSVSVTCILEHADGHAEETTLVGPIDNSGGKNGIQAVGSTVTYLQRYTLKAAIGVAASADTDGGNNPATDEDVAELRDAMAGRQLTDVERVGIERRIAAGMTASQIGQALAFVNGKPGKPAESAPAGDARPPAGEQPAADHKPQDSTETPPAAVSGFPYDEWFGVAEVAKSILGEDEYHNVVPARNQIGPKEVDAAVSQLVAATGASLDALRMVAGVKKPMACDLIVALESAAGHTLPDAKIEARKPYGIGENLKASHMPELRTYLVRLVDTLGPEAAQTAAQETV